VRSPAVLVLVALCTVACGRAPTPLTLPDEWPRVGVAHGSARLPADLVLDDDQLRVCIDGACGRDYAAEAGERAWRAAFSATCDAQPDEAPCDLRRGGGDVTAPTPSSELVREGADGRAVAHTLALRGRDSLVLFREVTSGSDAAATRAMTKRMQVLANRWHDGVTDCRPGHLVTASGFFDDAPSLGDAVAITAASPDATTIVSVELAIVEHPGAVARRGYPALERIATAPSVAVLAPLRAIASLSLPRERRVALRRVQRGHPRRDRAKVVRARRLTVGGLRGYEFIVSTSPRDGGPGHLLLQWGFAGRPNTPSAPHARLTMLVPYHGDAIASHMAYWAAMLNALRPLRSFDERCVTLPRSHDASR